jgi:DNA-binding transcriptional LysR family regulator
MIIDKFNLNHVRVFECVYRLRSMTEAAGELHLTQSGVSQHMSAFEEALGTKLFDRIKQKLVPTQEAVRLYEHFREGLFALERAVVELQGGHQHLTGLVSFGVPVEFGNNILIPRIADFAHENPLLRFNIRYGFANAVCDAIVKGELDFGFIDDFQHDERFESRVVFEETLLLCSCDKKVMKKSKLKGRKLFESLEYVDYQPGEPVVRKWLEHHQGGKKWSLNTRATAMDVQGVARMILSGLGVGVLPGYLVEKLKAEGKAIYVIEGNGKVLTNSIRLIYLRERTQSWAVKACLKAVEKFLSA